MKVIALTILTLFMIRSVSADELPQDHITDGGFPKACVGHCSSNSFSLPSLGQLYIKNGGNGARRVLASVHRTCEAKNPVSSSLDYFEANLKSGAKCSVLKNGEKSDSMGSLEFVASSFTSSCLKLHKKESLKVKSKLKAQQLQNFKKGIGSLSAPLSKNSCFKTPVFAPNDNSGLRPFLEGDVFVGGTEKDPHAFIFTRVGLDPLGIGKAVKASRVQGKNKCSTIKYEDFDFDLAQGSDAMKDKPTHLNSQTELKLSQKNRLSSISVYPYNKLMVLARQICEKNLTPGGFKANESNYLYSQDLMKVVRHQSKEAKCQYTEESCPDIQGDECADLCGLQR